MLGIKSIIDKNIILVGQNFTDIFIYNSNYYEHCTILMMILLFVLFKPIKMKIWYFQKIKNYFMEN